MSILFHCVNYTDSCSLVFPSHFHMWPCGVLLHVNSQMLRTHDAAASRVAVDAPAFHSGWHCCACSSVLIQEIFSI